MERYGSPSFRVVVVYGFGGDPRFTRFYFSRVLPIAVFAYDVFPGFGEGVHVTRIGFEGVFVSFRGAVVWDHVGVVPLFPDTFYRFDRGACSGRAIDLVASQFLRLTDFYGMVERASVVPAVVGRICDLVMGEFVVARGAGYRRRFIGQSSPVAVYVEFNLGGDNGC